MEKLVLATGNAHKLKEFREIFGPAGFSVVSAKDEGAPLDVEETGKTFEENAEIKARAVYDALKLPVVADDSGLVVDALQGRPGIYSARYAEGSDMDRVSKVLSEMAGVPDDKRTARFVCAICYIDENGLSHHFRGVFEGKIGWEASGENGFGYDPIFYAGGKSVASLPADEKNRISHRSKALAYLLEYLKKS